MSSTERVLIRAVRNVEYFPEIVFRENRRTSFAVPTRERTNDDTSINEFDYYEVDAVDVDSALKELTQINPGVEFIAYAPMKSAIRPAGDMVTKNISDKGVLP